MKKHIFLILPLVCMLFVSCSKEDDAEADYYYLECSQEMPTYVVSAFKTQVATDRTSDEITVKPEGGQKWLFKWTKVTSEPEGFSYKVTTTTYLCYCRVQIFKNGNVDFTDREISSGSSTKYQ